MTNITDHLIRYIHEGNAHYEVRDLIAGVVFHDENEFIPLADLALSRELGFFRRSLFPNEPVVAEYYPLFNIHPVHSPDGWQSYAIADNRLEYGYLLGEQWELVEAYHALKRAVECGELGECIAESHEALGRGVWLSTSEAVERCSQFDSEEYPLAGRRTYERLRNAARNGKLKAVNTVLHGWKFHRHALDEWLLDEDAHKTGPKG